MMNDINAQTVKWYNAIFYSDVDIVFIFLFNPLFRNPRIHRATTLYHFAIRGYAVAALNCTGNESDISDCKSNGRWNEPNCTYLDHAGVNCGTFDNRHAPTVIIFNISPLIKPIHLNM
jgi:hypothetical protein